MVPGRIGRLCSVVLGVFWAGRVGGAGLRYAGGRGGGGWSDTAVVDGQTGLLVRGHSVDDFADALGRIATDPLTRESMSQAAVKHAQGFGWELTARRTLAAYRTAAQTMAAELAAEVAG